MEDLTIVRDLICLFVDPVSSSSLAAAETPRAERVRREALDELQGFRAGVRDAIHAGRSSLFARSLARLLATMSGLDDEGALPPGTFISALGHATDLTATLIATGCLRRDLGEGVEAIILSGLAAASDA